MNVSHEHKLVFLAVPRTGSRVTFKTLQRLGLKGGAPNGGMTHEMGTPSGCETYLHVATVRSPFARWVSCWVWCRRWPVSPGAHYEKFAIWMRDNPTDFPGFVERAIVGGYIRPVSGYLGQVTAERWHLMRYESLQTDFANLPGACKPIGLRREPVVPLKHNPETLRWRSYYDAQTTELVVQHSARDFALYNYSENIDDH